MAKESVRKSRNGRPGRRRPDAGDYILALKRITSERTAKRLAQFLRETRAAERKAA
jgi:hypothetical protein